MNNDVFAEIGNAGAALDSSVGRGGQAAEQAHASGHYEVQCIDANGNVRWRESIENLVTTAGKNDALNSYLSGASYTAAWYIGLIGSTGYAAGVKVGDTMASHSGWVEETSYSEASRPVAAFASASGGSKSLSSAAVFNLTANVTIKGCFLASNASKGGTSGILYSAGLFTGGDKIVQNGDTLSVSYTASL